MGWFGVITNGGKNAIEQYIAGTATINFNLARVGSGACAEEAMRQATALQQDVTAASILKVTYEEGGTRFRLGFGPYGNGYTAREVGLFADVTIGGATSSVLFALWHEDGDGILVPGAESYEFLYTLAVPVSIINSENMTVTLNPDAYITRRVFEEEIEDIREYIRNLNVVDTIYPVGAIYTSVNSANPGTLFPGTTWAQLKNTFLVGASGDNDSKKPFPGGGSGGKSEYEAKDMPKHSHTRGSMNITGDVALGCATGWVEVDNRYRWGALSGAGNGTIGGNSSGGYSSTTHLRLNAADGWSGNTSESGDKEIATILPPYLAVYMWKRIA